MPDLFSQFFVQSWQNKNEQNYMSHLKLKEDQIVHQIGCLTYFCHFFTILAKSKNIRLPNISNWNRIKRFHQLRCPTLIKPFIMDSRSWRSLHSPRFFSEVSPSAILGKRRAWREIQNLYMRFVILKVRNPLLCLFRGDPFTL